MTAQHDAEQELRAAKEEAEQAIVHSDQKLLLDILHNLVANAIKYTEQGTALIGCRRRHGR